MRHIRVGAGNRGPLRHDLAPFPVVSAFLVLVSALANSRDWWLDTAFYGVATVVAWIAVARWPQRPATTWLLAGIPVPHLLGAFGFYHGSVGGVSWDVCVHTVTPFLLVLCLHSFLATPASPSKAILRVLVIGGVVLAAAVAAEVVEWAGGAALQREGEGVFFCGPGDHCAEAARCDVATDTRKDMLINVLGLSLGIIAVAYAHRSGAGRRPDAPDRLPPED